jgi:hypothetical protein
VLVTKILSLTDRVEPYYLVTKPDLPRYTCVEIKLKNGKVLFGELAHTRGSEQLPFGDEIMAQKFRTLAQVVLPPNRVEAIMQAVGALESLGAMADLVPLLQKQGR